MPTNTSPVATILFARFKIATELVALPVVASPRVSLLIAEMPPVLLFTAISFVIAALFSIAISPGSKLVIVLGWLICWGLTT